MVTKRILTATTKIHTYAQDLETVRNASVPATTHGTMPKQSTPQAVAPTTPAPVVPAVKMSATAQPSLPSKIRTPNIKPITHKPIETSIPKPIATPAPKPSRAANTNAIANLPAPHKKDPSGSGVPVPKIPVVPVAPPASPATPPVGQVTDSPPPLPTKISVPTPQPQTLVVGAKKRDQTYAATVITDAKRKRFSLWRELQQQLVGLFGSHPKQKTNTYSASTTPLRQGVVQNATTQTARQSIADYSHLKDRVKQRRDSAPEIFDTATPKTEVPIPATTAALREFETFLNATDIPAVGQQIPPVVRPAHILNASLTIKNTASPASTAATDTSWEHYVTEETVSSPAIPKPITTPPPMSREAPVVVTPAPVAPAPVIPHIPVPVAPAPVPTIPPSPVVVPVSPITPPVAPTQVPPPLQFTQPTITPSVPTATPIAPAEVVSTPSLSEVVIPAADTAPTFVTPTYQFTQPKIVPSMPTATSPAPALSPVVPPVVPIASVAPAPLPVQREPDKPIEQLPAARPIPHKTSSKKMMGLIAQFITTRTQTFLFGGVVTIAVLLVGGLAIQSLVTQFNTPTLVTPVHQFFNSSTVHAVPVSPLSALIITEQISRHNNAIGVSEISLQTSEQTPLSPQTLVGLLELPIDPAFGASLRDVRFGWYREAPFIVLHYAGDAVARGALLQWEQTLYTDFYSLFSLPVRQTNQTYRDEVMNGVDIRRQYGTDGNPELIYGQITPGHILITTSELAFLNLTNNFNPQ